MERVKYTNIEGKENSYSIVHAKTKMKTTIRAIGTYDAGAAHEKSTNQGQNRCSPSSPTRALLA